MRSTLPPADNAEVLLPRLGTIHASMAETTSNPDVIGRDDCDSGQDFAAQERLRAKGSSRPGRHRILREAQVFLDALNAQLQVIMVLA
jgi:hypothetical protein